MSKFQFLYYVTRGKTHYIDFHKHNSVELVYYLKGSGCTTISDFTYKYSSNTFSIITQDTYHDEKHYNDSDIIFIGFDYDTTLFTLENGLYEDNLDQSILNLLIEMRDELLEKKSFYEIKLDMLITELLIKFCRITENANSSKGGLVYAYKFIDENYNQKVDLQILAELSGYSYHRFRHIFKEQTGLSPVNYIIKARVDNAIRLLTSTDLSISRISSECGFSSTSQFCMQFKRLTGKTPAAYREFKAKEV